MAAATGGYLSSRIYDPSNMFASSSHPMMKNNRGFKAFGSETVNHRTIEPRQAEKKETRSINIDSMDLDDKSFFDFEPSTNTGSSYQDPFSTPGASGMPWGNEGSFHPLSPPDSASFSPKDPWAYPYQHQNPTSIFTDVDPASTRTQYGQVTPPNDERDDASLLDFQLGQERQRQTQDHTHNQDNDLPARKRKRVGQSSGHEQASQSIKRSRKYASRGGNVADVGEKPEDVKRSKFLERNRVAASKCRQKKKEWTQNLENRARELQKNNNLLRLSVESLRQEILFLKGEMLKHSSCDCEPIQSFIKSKANDVFETTDDGVVLKREQSPIESMPGSPGSRKHSSARDTDGSLSGADEPNVSIVNDENALGALLSNSLNHDMNEKSTAGSSRHEDELLFDA